jgi:cytochrome c553
MKNIIAIVSTIIVLGLMVLTFTTGTAFQGGEAGKIIEDMKYLDTPKTEIAKPKKEDTEKDKLKALEEKAGNTIMFKVSKAYKNKCSSCHGANGSGIQNGKKLMGPKLIGQSEAVLLKDLIDFKAGRKENIIMKGLLINTSEDELKEFAKEISQFQAKKDALAK